MLSMFIVIIENVALKKTINNVLCYYFYIIYLNLATHFKGDLYVFNKYYI